MHGDQWFSQCLPTPPLRIIGISAACYFAIVFCKFVAGSGKWEGCLHENLLEGTQDMAPKAGHDTLPPDICPSVMRLMIVLTMINILPCTFVSSKIFSKVLVGNNFVTV